MNTIDPDLGLPLPLTGSTSLYAIVGDPIDQAGSPGLFNRAFRSLGISAVLVPMHVPASSLEGLLALFREVHNWKGLVVTVPHKVEMAALVDELGPGALSTGAVNAIRKSPDGRLLGDNFDGEGFIRGLSQRGHAVVGKRVLIIGAGGAGRAVAHAVADAGATEIAVVDREVDRAVRLATELRERPSTAVAQGMRSGEEHAPDYEIIVNCAPPDGDAVPVNLAKANPQTLVADIVLKPQWTPLLAAAASRGLDTHTGIHMLTGQVDALLAFFQIPKPAST